MQLLHGCKAFRKVVVFGGYPDLSPSNSPSLPEPHSTHVQIKAGSSGISNYDAEKGMWFRKDGKVQQTKYIHILIVTICISDMSGVITIYSECYVTNLLQQKTQCLNSLSHSPHLLWLSEATMEVLFCVFVKYDQQLGKCSCWVSSSER